jgi:hypothetical protein
MRKRKTAAQTIKVPSNKPKITAGTVLPIRISRSLSDWELKVSIIPARCFYKTAAVDPFVSVES